MTDSALVVYAAPEEVRRDVLASAPSFAEVLPRGYDAERFARVVVKAIIGNPKLMERTRTSLLASVMEAAQLGLEPTGLLGSAYLVPYRKKVTVAHPTNPNATVSQTVNAAQLIVGYRGLIDLARRSGEIVAIQADVVRRRDAFDYEPTRQPEPVIHRPYIPDPGDPVELRDRGPVVGAYMVATLRGGFQQPEWMTYDDIELVRKSSKAADDGPWVGHWSEMARKTVVRRGSKYLPLTTELVHALELDEEAERDALSPTAHRLGPNLTRAAQMLVDRAARTPEEPRTVEPVAVDGSAAPGGSYPASSLPGDGSAEAEAEAEAAATGDQPHEEAPTDQEEPPKPPSGFCGDVHHPEDGKPGMGECQKIAGHAGGHRSEYGVWPRTKVVEA